MATPVIVPLLPRLRGLADFKGVRSLFINEMDEKVFTTSGGVGDRGGSDFRQRLRRQLQPELLDQQLEFRLRLGVPGQRQLSPVSRRQMDIDHLQGGEPFQRTARSQPERQGVRAALERDLQAVGQERDEDMSLDPALVLMEDRADRQIPLEVFERLLHGGKLDVVLPQQRGIGLGEVRAQQIPPSRRRALRNFCQFRVSMNMELSLSISMSTRRHAAGARDRAAPNFSSISSRGISMAASSRSRLNSHFICRLRIARSLVTRSVRSAKT